MKDALLVFLRVPQLGKVKTRLARTVGERTALEIYEQLISITLQQSTSDQFATYLYFDPYIDEKLWPGKWSPKLQTGEDLGIKMYHAFSEVLTLHDRAIIIGTDCPYITTELLIGAFEALHHCDVVIGPASDGGYYLIGLNKLIPQVFQNIHWGTDEVLPETLSRLEKLDFSVQLLEELHDVDHEADWEKYLKLQTR